MRTQFLSGQSRRAVESRRETAAQSKSRKPSSASSLNQLHLFRRNRRDAHALDAAIGRIEHFEPQAFVFDDFAFLGNSSGEFADQAGYGGGLAAFGPHAEELIEVVDIHVAGDDVGVVVFPDDLRFLTLVADFTYDFFDQVFDGYQAGYASVFIHYDCHADVTALHLAQQITY